MPSRRSLLVLGTLIFIATSLWWLRSRREHTAPMPPTPASTSTPLAPTATPAANERSILADGLNAPASTIQADIRILAGILEQWTTNFPAQGNPVGTNAEIIRALTGKNRLGLSLIPPDHPAINHEGELIDRWGTPFRFHQWSGTVMEITSAGPDRDFATADDVSSQ